MRELGRPKYLWTDFVDNVVGIANELEESPRGFVKKYGMKICSTIFLGANGLLIHQLGADPEQANFLRCAVAAPIQLATNAYQIKGDRQTAYDYGAIGGAAHTATCLEEEIYFNAITWGMYTQAAYKASAWPRWVGNILPWQAGHSEKKTRSNAFTENLGLLKDPHARAGTIAVASTVGQWIEAYFTQNQSLLEVMPLWLLAAGFYMAHGLVTAQDNKKAAEKPTISA